MANLRLFLSHSRRRCVAPSQTLALVRSFCSSSSSSSSSPIKPVSYPVKPKYPEQQQQQQSQQQQQDLDAKPPSPQSPSQRSESFRQWTREDARFVKDAPSISPVSYPSRVVPLPEDRTKEEEDREAGKGEDEELRREPRRIQSNGRGRSRPLLSTLRSSGGKIYFEKCITTHAFMPCLSKIARILGPRGLMPNPKMGSVTNDVAPALKAAKCGRTDFRADSTANVHVGLGKLNFSEEAQRENIGAFVNALLLAKPVGLKKTSKHVGYVKKFTLTSTMGVGFPVTIQPLSAAADNYSKPQASK